VASRTWFKVSNRGVRFGGSDGGAIRIGFSEGTGGLRVNGSVGGRRGRVGESIPIGGGRRRRSVWYGWFK
jgi:hypothetical protein